MNATRTTLGRFTRWTALPWGSGVITFGTGVVFAAGLGISGMTRPAKVVAFLDVTGNWDPSLALVMVGAIATYAGLSRAILRRSAPLADRSFAIPTRTDIDRPLILGAALFGIGWGAAGFCPGPALTAVASGEPSALLFVGAMIAGMYLHRLMGARQDTRGASPRDVWNR